MSIEASLTMIAICLLILLIFAIIISIYLIRLLIVLKKAAQATEHKVSGIIDDAKKVVNSANDMAMCLKNNIELTTPLFHSIRKISNLLEEFPSRFKNEMHDNNMTINFEAKQGKFNLSEWSKWIALGVILAQKLKNN